MASGIWFLYEAPKTQEQLVL
jgi:hypothetical protein